MVYHFAHTVAGSKKRILCIIRNQCDPGCGSHFHNSGIAVFQISIISIDWSTHGSGDGQIDPLSVHAFNQGVRGALSAVCEWFYDDFCIWFCQKNSLLNGHSSFY